MKKINEIYELFNDFSAKNQGYFDDLQIGQLAILRDVITNDTIAADIKLQILFETCKQLLTFVDEKIQQKKALSLRSSQAEEGEETRYKSRNSQFFSTQFAAVKESVKETLNIGQEEQILADKVMGALFIDAHDEYFKINVHRYLEAHKRLDPAQQEISATTINSLLNLLREPLTAKEVYEKMQTDIEKSPLLKKAIDAQYDLYKEYWVPQHIAGKETKKKKTARSIAVIENLSPEEFAKAEIKSIENSLYNAGIDFRTIDIIVSASRNKSEDQILSEIKMLFSKSKNLDDSTIATIQRYLKAYNELLKLTTNVNYNNSEPSTPSSSTKKQ